MGDALDLPEETIHAPADFRVRPAVAADAAAIALVAQATFLDSYANIVPVADLLPFLEAEHSAAAYARYLGGYAQLWLAEATRTGAPLGYAMVTPCDLPGTQAGDIELKRIYALPATHGSGLGAALMAVAVEAARSAGHARILLGVHRGNARALAFYARQGFAAIGTRTFSVGASDFHDLVLARDLGN